MRKRILSFLLVASMIFSMFGFSLSVSASPLNYTGAPDHIVNVNITGETPNASIFVAVYHSPPGFPEGRFTLESAEGTTSATGAFSPTLFPGRLYAPAWLRVVVGNDERPPIEIPVGDRFQITFVGNGGTFAGGATTTQVETVISGSLAAAPAITAPAGYTFDGWRTVGGAVVTFPHTFTDHTTLYASWVNGVVNAPVTFGVNGSGGGLRATRPEGSSAVPVISGDERPINETITFIPEPDDGFRVAGWSVTRAGNAQGFGPGVNPQWEVVAGGLDVRVQFEPITAPPRGRFPNVVGVEPPTGPGHTRPIRETDEPDGPPDPLTIDPWRCLCFRRPPFSNRIASEWFDDVAAGQWYHGHVSVSLSNDAFRGVAPRTFAPQTTMSRAMFAQVLFNLVSCCFDIGLYWNQPSPFTDVTQDDWFFPVINWAYAHNLISGVGGGRFAPNDPVTREQMAALLNRFAAAESITFPTGATPAFTDQAQISSWAVADVQAIQGAGIVGGFPDGSFRPQGNATRAEVATIFAGFLNMVQAQYAGQ